MNHGTNNRAGLAPIESNAFDAVIIRLDRLRTLTTQACQESESGDQARLHNLLCMILTEVDATTEEQWLFHNQTKEVMK